MSLHFAPPGRAERLRPHRFFEPMVGRVQAALAADLRLALERGELFLQYQPIASIDSGRIECLEALLRWQHPTRGVIMPDDFVPVAEASGMIVALGEWALAQACADAVSWNPRLRLAVNVSPIQIRDSNLVATVERALAASGLPASRLELEITESAPIENTARYRAVFTRLRRLGVAFVMDDFGTGYASLANFRRFKFDKIKIDRSLVGRMLDDDDARATVEAVIALGRTLDLKVVAEGVETEEQLAMLRSQGCPQAQGYFISPPMPIAHFTNAAPGDEAGYIGAI